MATKIIESFNTHELKVHPQFYGPLERNEKPFEVRRDDRHFRINDLLVLREWTPQFGYTGRQTGRRVTFILKHEDLPNGVPIGFVVMGLGLERVG